MKTQNFTCYKKLTRAVCGAIVQGQSRFTVSSQPSSPALNISHWHRRLLSQLENICLVIHVSFFEHNAHIKCLPLSGVLDLGFFQSLPTVFWGSLQREHTHKQSSFCWNQNSFHTLLLDTVGGFLGSSPSAELFFQQNTFVQDQGFY